MLKDPQTLIDCQIPSPSSMWLIDLLGMEYDSSSAHNQQNYIKLICLVDEGS